MNKSDKSRLWRIALAALLLTAGAATATFASEADINLPDLSQVRFFGGQVPGLSLMYAGLVVCLIGLVFALIQYNQIKNLPVHSSMNSVS
jgi:K(+)-stimulated pyrophosphate-energized sodium pump